MMYVLKGCAVGIGTVLQSFDEEVHGVTATNLLMCVFFLMSPAFHYWLNLLICKVMI